jgi:MFS family permease
MCAHLGKQNVGFAMTAVGRLAGALVLIPGGALTDASRWKRGLAAVGLLMVPCSGLIFALKPDWALVIGAEFLHGASAGFIGPAIAAIRLGIVGRRAMSARTDRNKRLSGAGNGLTALSMGTLGS